MPPTFDPFKILDVSKNATDEEVKRAYRAKAAKYHPDAGGDAWVFQQVHAAYTEVLKQRIKPPNTDSEPVKDPITNPYQSTPDKRTGTCSPQNGQSPKSQIPSASKSELLNFFVSNLPLQNETTYFILVNVLDIFATYALLRMGGIEANPLANYFLQLWNVKGLVIFKMAIVAFVAIVAQVIARRNPKRASQVLNAGTIIVSMVVIYSVYLLAQKR